MLSYYLPLLWQLGPCVAPFGDSGGETLAATTNPPLYPPLPSLEGTAGEPRGP
jgi:hypothetical protein